MLNCNACAFYSIGTGIACGMWHVACGICHVVGVPYGRSFGRRSLKLNMMFRGLVPKGRRRRGRPTTVWGTACPPPPGGGKTIMFLHARPGAVRCCSSYNIIVTWCIFVNSEVCVFLVTLSPLTTGRVPDPVCSCRLVVTATRKTLLLDT